MPTNRLPILAIAIRTAAVLVLLAVSIGIFSWLYMTRPKPVLAEDAGSGKSVLVMPIMRVSVPRQWFGFGTVRAMDSADVPARVSAVVEYVPEGVLEGAAVEVGDLLARLDDSDFQRELEIATQTIADIKAQLDRLENEEQAWTQRSQLAAEAVELAQREYDRVLAAAEQGVAKQRELDAARQALINAKRDQVATEESLDAIGPRRSGLRAQLQAQEAQQRLARQRVERCEIKAPIGGVIELVDVEVGENIAVGARIARIVDVDRLEVPVRLPASARPLLEPGASVTLESTGRQRQRIETRIDRLSPTDDESTRTLIAYVVLDEENDPAARQVAPGRFLSAVVTSSEAAMRQVVPRRAVRDGRVRVVVDGAIELVPVETAWELEGTLPQTGLDDRQWIVLGDELADGLLVVVDGGLRLQPGQLAQPLLTTELAGASGGP